MTNGTYILQNLICTFICKIKLLIVTFFANLEDFLAHFGQNQVLYKVYNN